MWGLTSLPRLNLNRLELPVAGPLEAELHVPFDELVIEGQPIG